MEAVIGTEPQDDVDNFFQAIKNEDYELMDELISKGKINLNKLYRPNNMHGIFCMACYSIYFQKEEVFKFLMRRGTDPNLYAIYSILGYTIQYYTEQVSRLNIIKYLLKNGADPNFTPPLVNARNPLTLSIVFRQLNYAKLLLKFGADPNSIEPYNGRTMLNLSSTSLDDGNFKFQMVKLLLEYNANSEDKSFLENIYDLEERKELEELCYSNRKGIAMSRVI